MSSTREASFMSITCVGGREGRNWLMFGELRSSQGKDKGDQSLTTEYKGWSPSLQEIHHHWLCKITGEKELVTASKWGNRRLVVTWNKSQSSWTFYDNFVSGVNRLTKISSLYYVIVKPDCIVQSRTKRKLNKKVACVWFVACVWYSLLNLLSVAQYIKGFMGLLK